MEYLVGLVVYSIFEYALGKLSKPKANSTIELVENAVKIIIKNRTKNPWE